MNWLLLACLLIVTIGLIATGLTRPGRSAGYRRRCGTARQRPDKHGLTAAALVVGDPTESRLQAACPG
jgi:hypothetical protein